MGKNKKTYEPMPEVPEELRQRYETILAVLSGKLTVSEAARQLGLSRNHFQTVMHRSLQGMIQGLAPKPTGRPPAARDEEKERLQKENARLRDRVGTIDRLMEVAGGILRGQVKLTGRMREPRAKEKSGGDETDEDDPAAKWVAVLALRRLGLTMVLAAALVGASPATLRRWRVRVQADEPGIRQRGPAAGPRPVPPDVEQRVEAVVRETRGLLGAEALRYRVPEVSRRRAAAIKRATVTAMERERKAGCARMIVTAPGVLRGFDQLFVGDRTVLVSADACVPFRTSSLVVERYDGEAVADALERDWAENGAPLVERLDRARAHQVDEVVALAERHGVLLLHGPPRYPQFYGQLERQNREHRAWLDTLPDLDPDALGPAFDKMRHVLNCAWPRRSLQWRTAWDLWTQRPRISPAERLALRDDVADRTVRIARHLMDRGQPADLAGRLAIEQALAHRGLVRREAGGWC